MGIQQSTERLSEELEEKIMSVFHQIDHDKSGSINRINTLNFWKSNFAKVNTEALFQAVDLDNNGSISAYEWLEFWQKVKKGGRCEQEIEDELHNLLDGFSWVSFSNVRDACAGKMR